MAAHAATIVITWPLWSVHERPPMLPALEWVPAVGVGVPLLLAVVAQLWAPRAGLAAYFAVLLYAWVCDETRMQPQFVSLGLLAVATWPSAGARLVGRAHVVLLWFYAGLYKVLSPAFVEHLAPEIVHGVWPGAPSFVSGASGYVLGCGEMALALLAVPLATRRVMGWAAFFMHVGILTTLAPRANLNASIWAWNFVLAASGFGLFTTWKTALVPELAAARRAVRALVLTMAVFPLGWHVGLVDAYLAFHLYSVDVPVPDATHKPFKATWSELHVPIPPEHRLFVRLFDATCAPGDTMVVKDTRAFFVARGLGRYERRCPR